MTPLTDGSHETCVARASPSASTFGINDADNGKTSTSTTIASTTPPAHTRRVSDIKKINESSSARHLGPRATRKTEPELTGALVLCRLQHLPGALVRAYRSILSLAPALFPLNHMSVFITRP